MFLIEENNESGNNDYQDRRIFARLRAEVSLRYLEKEDDEKTGVTLDISAQGLGLVSSECLRPDTQITLFLKFPGTKEEFVTVGKIVWCRKVDEKTFRTGVYLEKPELMIVSQLMKGKE